MAEAVATVSTEHASRYLQQLCKHWAHKFATDFGPDRGRIDMGEGRTVDMTAAPDQLTVRISSTGDAARLQQVVEDHIVRFAFRETLAFDWRAA
ncbi:DUF2218 domain-containing protein [Paracoccus luteus]|uniref:DUF2218 domain-containing protein n=1 Tax=Paracoccus luteus TaxID=2508543 RepID=UPI00106F4EFF|nr:DUF2218 domain-containing protein [Paracoccus luteus]